MPLEMEWNTAYILRKLNVKETQRNHFCLCLVLPFSLCVCMSLQPCYFPWQLCGEWDRHSDPIAVRYWDRSLSLDCLLGFDSCCPLCSGEPLGAPKSSVGGAVLLFTRGRAPGRAREAQQRILSLGQHGAGLDEEGWLSGLMRKRRDTVSLQLSPGLRRDG